MLLAVLQLIHRLRFLEELPVLLIASFFTFLVVPLGAVGIAVEVAAPVTTNGVQFVISSKYALGFLAYLLVGR